MLAFFQRWWDDPVASSGLAIAIVGGIFAVYSLRVIPAERRLGILNAMEDQYKLTQQARGRVLRQFPFLLMLAIDQISDAVQSELLSLKDIPAHESADAAAKRFMRLRHLKRLEQESLSCRDPDMGISYTAAFETLASEFKTRAMLWCVETLTDETRRRDAGIDEELYGAARVLVGQLNGFALNYENATYPPRTLFGQLHRSLAPVIKALEPVIWAGSTEGRWGRRVLRLGIAAEHFNDVVRIHRSSDLVWSKSKDVRVIVHPAYTQNVYGKEALRYAILRYDIPGIPKLLPMARLHIITFYWSIIGRLNPSPGNWRWAFGGRRLQRHVKSEDTLSGCIRYAMSLDSLPDGRASLAFSWTLDSLRQERARAARDGAKSPAEGRLTWLYVRRPSGPADA